MYLNRIFLLLTIVLNSIISYQVFAEGTCTLSNPSDSPVQKWRENINIVRSAVRTEADRSICDTTVSADSPSGFASYAAKVIPLSSSIDLMREVYSLSSLWTDFYAEVDSFLDQAGPLMELKSNVSDIEEIERDIIETAHYVWSRCAQSVKMKTNPLKDISTYNTEWRTLWEISIDMAKQTKEVKRFFQILSQWIQTEEYIDEVPFSIATPGFSKDMYVYYSPKNLQECRDNDPRKKAFWEVMKGAFTSGWKYPQAIQIWKDAMALLLYRGGQLISSGEYDESKEAQINSIVQARKGGVWNSDIMINSQFFKEFGYRPKSQTMDEKTNFQGRKAFYETIGYWFVRKVIPALASQDWTDGTWYVKNIDTLEVTQKIQRYQELDASFYEIHNNRKQLVASSKESVSYRGVSDLTKVLERYKPLEKLTKKTFKNICSIFQAENVPGKVECNS